MEKGTKIIVTTDNKIFVNTKGIIIAAANNEKTKYFCRLEGRSEHDCISTKFITKEQETNQSI